MSKKIFLFFVAGLITGSMIFLSIWILFPLKQMEKKIHKETHKNIQKKIDKKIDWKKTVYQKIDTKMNVKEMAVGKNGNIIALGVTHTHMVGLMTTAEMSPIHIYKKDSLGKFKFKHSLQVHRKLSKPYLLFSKNNKYLFQSTTISNKINVWSTEKWKIVSVLKTKNPIISMDIDYKFGILYTCSRGSISRKTPPTIQKWDTKTLKAIEVVKIDYPNKDYKIKSFNVKDGNLIIATNKTIRSFKKGKESLRIKLKSGIVTKKIHIANNSKYFIHINSKYFANYDLNTFKVRKVHMVTVNKHMLLKYTVSIHPTSKYYAFSFLAKLLFIYNNNKKKLVATLDQHNSLYHANIKELEFSRNGKWLFSADSNGRITVYKL